MAGRGRGRGKGSMSFDVSSLGFGRGEALPNSTLQPPPLYPPLDFKPLPMTADDDDLYILAIKQEFCATMKDSPYYHETDISVSSSAKKRSFASWLLDWKNIPNELKPTKKRRVVQKKKIVIQELPDIDKELKEPVKEDGDENEEDKEEEIEEVYEEDEEENDYNFNYFDDGGDDYGGEEDADEGPVY